MGTISVSLPSDGETIEAADYNTPITTIVNEINGNLDNDNIDAAAAIAGSKLADGGITFAKLLSTIFSGELTTYTNPGTAGGTNTFYYANIGGIKVFYGLTAAQTSNNASPSYTVTFPVGFFSSIRMVNTTAADMTSDARQYTSINSVTTTTLTLSLHAPNGAATTKAFVLAIGS